MKESTIANMETIVGALRTLHNAENVLLGLQDTLEVCLLEVGTGTLGEGVLMPLVPIVRFNEAEDRLLRALAHLATDEVTIP